MVTLFGEEDNSAGIPLQHPRASHPKGGWFHPRSGEREAKGALSLEISQMCFVIFQEGSKSMFVLKNGL